MNLRSKQTNENDISLAGKPLLPPASQSLLIQIFSFLLCLLITFFVGVSFKKNIPPIIIIFAQAIAACCFSYWRKMDWWWWIIHFLFPLAVFVLLAFDIPRYYYLCGFIFLALLFWSTFRTQVPYCPSKSSLLPTLFELLPDRPVHFVDVGSGLGGLVLKLAQVRRDSFFYGVEIAPLPWFISYLRAKFNRAKVEFLFRSYERIDLNQFDVVFAYLSPAAMPSLWEKVRKEMTPGSLLLSYEFIVPNVAPDLCINKNPNDPTLYVWRI